MILISEVPRQLMNPTQMKLPARNHAQNAGKTTGRATCSNTPRRNRLRHAKACRAESEHRGARVLEVELPPVDLRDVGEQDGGVAAVLVDQRREITEQLLLVDVLK